MLPYFDLSVYQKVAVVMKSYREQHLLFRWAHLRGLDPFNFFQDGAPHYVGEDSQVVFHLSAEGVEGWDYFEIERPILDSEIVHFGDFDWSEKPRFDYTAFCKEEQNRRLGIIVDNLQQISLLNQNIPCCDFHLSSQFWAERVEQEGANAIFGNFCNTNLPVFYITNGEITGWEYSQNISKTLQCFGFDSFDWGSPQEFSRDIAEEEIFSLFTG